MESAQAQPDEGAGAGRGVGATIDQVGHTAPPSCVGVSAGVSADLSADLAAALSDLRAIAAAALASEQDGHTLQPTALVSELYVKLASSKGFGQLQFATRDHMLAYATEAIANILVDHARRKKAKKRGGGVRPVGIEGRAVSDGGLGTEACERAMEVAGLLDRLENEHPVAARVARMRCFGYMNDASIANVLGISPRSASSYWKAARAWMAAELEVDRPDRS
ncbi:MAG: hypothetical protein KIT54_07605 [Phycisphaeraceae bacterium]|nr:hypothetical protein [Phycisphaeraceae bacterium]